MNAHRQITTWLTFALLSSTVYAADPLEQQVTFPGTDGVHLAGTLVLPSNDEAAKFPAMVLIAGSGPTDRDGNQPPAIVTDLLKQIARAFAEKGIVTLRFDKRGMYASRAELPKDPAKFDDFFSWEHFRGDAAGAYRFLRQHAKVDPKRVGMLGHSEGGLLALEAAQAMKGEGHRPVVLMLLSTPGRSIDTVIADQLKGSLERQGATQEQIEFFVRENNRIAKYILKTGEVPTDVPRGLAALYPTYLGKFYHSELAVDPTKLAAAFHGPVMVVAGSADTQVSADRDARALDAALAAREGDVHTLVIVPNASHNLKAVARPSDQGFDGPIAPSAIDRMQEWLLSQLSQR